jgi:hypothetical protein
MSRDLQERKKINSEIKKLNSAMAKLENDGFNVVTNDVHYQGYGFTVLLEGEWIKVWVNLNYQSTDEVIISKYKRVGSVLDSFSAPQIAKEKTTNFDDIYSIVKRMVDLHNNKFKVVVETVTVREYCVTANSIDEIKDVDPDSSWRLISSSKKILSITEDK